MTPRPLSALLNAALLRWLDELATTGIFATDTNLVICSWNGWLSRTTGLAADDVVGRPLFEIQPALVDSGFERYYRSALLGHSSVLAQRFHRYLLRIPTAGGDMPQTARITPLLDSERVIGTLTVIEDVAERVTSENELRRQILAAEKARAAAEEALRAKDEFLATLSHELRTPLNAVLGWTSILRGGDVEPALIVRALDVIERNAHAQARLIDDMLDMARIVTGKFRLEMSIVDVVAATSSALDVVRPSAQTKRITLRTDWGDGPKFVQADPERLQQIVWNILANAVKFTPPGGTIDVRVEDVRGTVRIAIADTGKGISADFLPYVFDRFRQANSSASRSEGGLGLGLALVRQLVDMQGGDVTVESAGLGRGATFTIMFPSVQPALQTLPTENRLPADALASLRVMLVDDDADWRDALSRALQALGAETLCAGTAREALAFVQTHAAAVPDVLILDIGLAGQDGHTLLQQIRTAHGPFRKVPALALTAYKSDEHQRRALAGGFADFLAKPISPEQVARRIKAVVGSRVAAGPTASRPPIASQRDSSSPSGTSH